ncbi:MAG TPA: hypothetical protein VHB02_13620 [Acidimicrobiales bacterium]|nr:hypothetical protein [Acidimicrobiales bacterium]
MSDAAGLHAAGPHAAGPHAVELYLDEAADAAVRTLWAALEAVGVPSLATQGARHYRPHVSFCVFDGLDRPSVSPEWLAPCLGLELWFGDLSFVLRREPAAALAVVPDLALLDCHRRLSERVGPHVRRHWDDYRPGRFVPRCTLALSVRRPDLVVATVSANHSAPLRATVTGAAVVSVADGAEVLAVADLGTGAEEAWARPVA